MLHCDRISLMLPVHLILADCLLLKVTIGRHRLTECVVSIEVTSITRGRPCLAECIVNSEDTSATISRHRLSECILSIEVTSH